MGGGISKEEMEAQLNSLQVQHGRELSEMRQEVEKARMETFNPREEMRKPIIQRAKKLAFVNNLKIPIRQSGSVLLVGPKGAGKSTFMWLLGKGEKPEQSLCDGTTNMIQLAGFIDPIGLRGWTKEELLKLLVLLIYEGIPKDLIVFGNDRVMVPVTILATMGIINPMIVVMSSDFWANYEPEDIATRSIRLVTDSQGVRKVHPDTDLKKVFNTLVYKKISEAKLGTPITHHESIDTHVKERNKNGLQPFQHLLQMLGRGTFRVGDDNEEVLELLFRFIYLFERVYEKDKLDFMNNATLQEFTQLPYLE